MNEPESSPRKHDRDNEKKRQEQSSASASFRHQLLDHEPDCLVAVPGICLSSLPGAQKFLTASSRKNWLVLKS